MPDAADFEETISKGPFFPVKYWNQVRKIFTEEGKTLLLYVQGIQAYLPYDCNLVLALKHIAILEKSNDTYMDDLLAVGVAFTWLVKKE